MCAVFECLLLLQWTKKLFHFIYFTFGIRIVIQITPIAFQSCYLSWCFYINIQLSLHFSLWENTVFVKYCINKLPAEVLGKETITYQN